MKDRCSSRRERTRTLRIYFLKRPSRSRDEHTSAFRAPDQNQMICTRFRRNGRTVEALRVRPRNGSLRQELIVIFSRFIDKAFWHQYCDLTSLANSYLRVLQCSCPLCPGTTRRAPARRTGRDPAHPIPACLEDHLEICHSIVVRLRLYYPRMISISCASSTGAVSTCVRWGPAVYNSSCPSSKYRMH